jgi:hypothetical protein
MAVVVADNPGIVGNTIAAAMGGVGIGQLLQILMPALFRAGDGLDVGAIVAQNVAGGVGGAILTLIAGLVKASMAKG